MALSPSLFRSAAVATALALGPGRAEAQLAPSDARFWVGAGVLFGAACAFDARLSTAASRNTRTSLDRFASTLEPLGRAGVDEPVLAAALVGSWVVGGWRPAKAVLRVAAGWVVGDLLMSGLKPLVGRHRPDSVGGDPWRFKPFARDAVWHSLPSAHTTHVFALAAGVAEEVRLPVVGIAAYATAALVGWQRIAFRGHWPSDVVAGAVLGIVSARTTNRWLRGGLLPDSTRRHAQLTVLPGAMFVSVPLP